MAIDNKNKVYSWGYNGDGQCGDGTDENIFIPKLIDSLKLYNIKKIKCGYNHSYVCTNDGNHYLFGNNEYNECIESGDNKVLTPYLINQQIDENINNGNDDKIIKDIYLGCETTIIMIGDK